MTTRDRDAAGDEDPIDTDFSRLYRSGATEGPPASLDAAIVAAAHRAVATEKPAAPPPRPAHRRTAAPFSGRWIVPAAIAATVVIAIGLRPYLAGTDHAPAVPAAPVPAAPSLTTPELHAVESPARQSTGPLPAMVPAPAPPRVRTVDPVLAPAPQPAAAANRAGTPDEAGPPSAEGWLETIEALLADGRQDAARAAFYAFRERHPDHPIPDDLLTRLGM